MKTFRPLDFKSKPKEEAKMPLPNEETTPPVTNINLDIQPPSRVVPKIKNRGQFYLQFFVGQQLFIKFTIGPLYSYREGYFEAQRQTFFLKLI